MVRGLHRRTFLKFARNIRENIFAQYIQRIGCYKRGSQSRCQSNTLSITYKISIFYGSNQYIVLVPCLNCSDSRFVMSVLTYNHFT